MNNTNYDLIFHNIEWLAQIVQKKKESFIISINNLIEPKV